MNNQKSIQHFFKPLATNIVYKDTQLKMSSTKRIKLSNGNSSKENKTLDPNTNGNEIKEVILNESDAKTVLKSENRSDLSKYIGATWLEALKDQFQKEYFIKLSEFVERERNKYTIFPPTENVFSWTQLCPIKEVKVVLLGQDPYHGRNQAHGLAFSVQKGISIPPSLANIYKELEQDIEDFEIPQHGDLTEWAKQGVLLLNSCLTVRSGLPNSHCDQGWEKFTTAVVKWINDNLNNIVFLLWGAYAQKKGEIIDKNKHYVLKCAHPSPFSAYKGFFKCNHFSKTNLYLIKNQLEPIRWSNLGPD